MAKPRTVSETPELSSGPETGASELTPPRKISALPPPPETEEKALPSAEHLFLRREKTQAFLQEDDG
ncbi:hypothetical protein JW752_03620 [Candidatus Peregrinibacteria bacterium]|nr:hypothetical protein [Candidatus Peregrinibacteria bacterium]